MTDDHAFIDPDDIIFSGKEQVLDAWRRFFDAFPDYRNVWASITSCDGLLIAIGSSKRASEPQLFCGRQQCCSPGRAADDVAT